VVSGVEVVYEAAWASALLEVDSASVAEAASAVHLASHLEVALEAVEVDSAVEAALAVVDSVDTEWVLPVLLEEETSPMISMPITMVQTGVLRLVPPALVCLLTLGYGLNQRSLTSRSWSET
jgi:hypothetical protein